MSSEKKGKPTVIGVCRVLYYFAPRRVTRWFVQSVIGLIVIDLTGLLSLLPKLVALGSGFGWVCYGAYQAFLDSEEDGGSILQYWVFMFAVMFIVKVLPGLLWN